MKFVNRSKAWKETSTSVPAVADMISPMAVLSGSVVVDTTVVIGASVVAGDSGAACEVVVASVVVCCKFVTVFWVTNNDWVCDNVLFSGTIVVFLTERRDQDFVEILTMQSSLIIYCLDFVQFLPMGFRYEICQRV